MWLGVFVYEALGVQVSFGARIFSQLLTCRSPKLDASKVLGTQVVAPSRPNQVQDGPRARARGGPGVTLRSIHDLVNFIRSEMDEHKGFLHVENPILTNVFHYIKIIQPYRIRM